MSTILGALEQVEIHNVLDGHQDGDVEAFETFWFQGSHFATGSRPAHIGFDYQIRRWGWLHTLIMVKDPLLVPLPESLGAFGD